MTDEGMKELVARLRKYARISHMSAAWGFAGEGYTMEKAADVIEELQEQLNSATKNE